MFFLIITYIASFSLHADVDMNGKASVSKELNAKHSKVLEGLLRLPENRECADCRSKAPRWASINLGIFVCMQCSGIHRGLGVHISQVRSITLDTWLPEQVEFMQSVGNAKSNEYWEAELPPNYDRSEIERFIRAKYVDKRWASKIGKKPAAISSERSTRYNTCDDHRSRSVIPTKTKRLSLDEQSFHSHTGKIAPLDVKTRTGSLDMSDLMTFFPGDVACNQSSKEEHSYVPPPSWATFECKWYPLFPKVLSMIDDTYIRHFDFRNICNNCF